MASRKFGLNNPATKDRLAYIVENKDALFIVARTIYVLREGKLATKEEAISYVKRTYPPLRLLGDLLLQLYTSAIKYFQLIYLRRKRWKISSPRERR